MNKPKTKNQKIFLITLIILSTLLIHTGLANAQNTLEECNAQGGIWCAYNVNCIGANQDHYENPDTVCVVTESQNVTLSQSQTKYNIDNPKIFELNELELKEEVILQFYNAPYDDAYAAESALGTAGLISRNGVLAITTINKGGDGGDGYGPLGRADCGSLCWAWECGGFLISDAVNMKYGGGGAAGAAGGQIGQHGGAAINVYGRLGENDATVQATDSKGGRGGGFIKLILNDLKLFGDISVNGEDGEPGKDANPITSTNYGGSGGGPGSGGGGGGQIELNVLNNIQGSGLLTANGGKGGDGGEGALGGKRRYCSTNEWGNLHGGGGGAGGGGSAGNILFLNDVFAHQCQPGQGGFGGKGQCSSCTKYEQGGFESCCSESGEHGSRGEYSQTCGSRTLEWFPYPDRIEQGELEILTSEQKKELMRQYCNSGDDSDGDGLPDMADPDCYDMLDSTYGAAKFMGWDSSIRSDFEDPIDSSVVSWFNASASDGSDLVCGDDLPSFQQQETNNEAEGQCVGQYYLGCEFRTDGSSDGLEEHVTRKCMDYWNQYGGGGCLSAPDYCIRNSERDTPIGEQTGNHCVSVENPQCSMFNQETCTLSGSTEIGGESYPYQFGDMCQDKGFMQCSGLSPQVESYCLAHNGCTWQGESNNNNNDEFTMGDLGFITPIQGRFACFDNSLLPRTDMFKEPSISSPGNHYTWRDARNSVNLAKIMRVQDTMFISNLASWFYCDVGQDSGLTSEFTINEYDFLQASSEAMNPSCSAELSRFLRKDIIDCEAYDGTSYDPDCEANFIDQSEYHHGYCETLQNNEILTFNAAIPDFIEACRYCMINEGEGGSLISFGEYVSINSIDDPNEGYDAFRNSYCSAYSYDIDFCGHTTSNAGPGFLNSQFCKDNQDLCLGTAFSTDMSCAQIHHAFEYSYSQYKLCDLSYEYCQGGFLTDSLDGVCCVGPSSFCAPIADLSCLDMGGEIFFEDVEVCLGNHIELENGDQCCFGRVTPSQSFIMPNTLSGESFICYSHLGKGFISECCGPNQCSNSDNPLNRRRDVLAQVYSMTGAPYHMIASFDSNDEGENVVSRVINEDFNGRFSFSEQLSNPSGILPSFRSDFSVEDFDYLEFDLLTNGIQFLEEIQLVDADDVIWSFDFQQHLHRENFRFQRIKLDLSSPPNGFNIQEVLDVVFTFSPNADFEIVVDRLHLTSTNADMNSDQRYCSGDWGKWIENLDGPNGDRGFFQGAIPPENLMLSDFGPYRDACEGTMTTVWTGSACCGDNTHPEFGEHGEYWIDTRGVCWNGTGVTHDTTLASRLSRDYMSRSRLEKSLLFFGGKTWICDYDKENYNENYRFNSNDVLTTTTLSSRIADEQVVAPFTIKGGWMCEGGVGWTRLGDVNRITLLASFFLNEAAEQGHEDEFTIHCGDREQVANYFVSGTEDDYDTLVGNFCLLRTGKNTDFIQAGGLGGIGNTPQGDIFIAFESKYMNESLLDQINETLVKAFPVLHDSNIDCTNAPPNPTAENFFTKCNLESEYFEGTIYYNLPLQLVMVTSEKIQTQNFLQTMWSAFVNFFTNLFGGGGSNDTSFMYLQDFSTFEGSNELYIAKQGDKVIVGKTELIGPVQKIRIDYTNLATNTSFLARNLNTKTGSNVALWAPNEFTQTIFTLVTLENNFLNFNELTSIIRLVDVGTPVNFGTQSSCAVTLADAQQEWESGEQNIVYEVPSSLNCNAETKTIMCYNGNLLDSNLQPINTENYYLNCAHELPPITQNSLQLTIIGQGAIAILNGPTITQSTTLQINEGSTRTLTAVPEQGWSFVEWRGYEEEGENIPQITITMNTDLQLEATFQQGEIDDIGGPDPICNDANCPVCHECNGDICVPITGWDINPIWQPWGMSQLDIPDNNIITSAHHHGGRYCQNGATVYDACTTQTHTNPNIQSICNNIICLYEYSSDGGGETGCQGTPGSCTGYLVSESIDIPGVIECNQNQVTCQLGLPQGQFYVPQCPTTGTPGGSGGSGGSDPIDSGDQGTGQQEHAQQ